VKHANPCGVAIGRDAADAYARAFRTDPTSAFGGIIAFNRPVDGAAARAVSKQFVEVVLAPAYDYDARGVISTKAKVRVLRIAIDDVRPDGARRGERGHNTADSRRVGAGLSGQRR